jgi:hypothetical protein
VVDSRPSLAIVTWRLGTAIFATGGSFTTE